MIKLTPIREAFRKDGTKFAGLLLLVLVLWIFTPIVMDRVTHESMKKGQLGDQFGSISALFSGFGLAGIFYTIFLQIGQLKLQRRELARARTEARNSRGQFQQQIENMNGQQILSLFNHLLSDLSNVLERVEFTRTQYKSQGINAPVLNSETVHGAHAINRFRGAGGQQFPLVQTKINEPTLIQYLNLYLLSVNLTNEMKNLQMRTICHTLITQVHGEAVKVVLDNLTIFSFIIPGLHQPLAQTFK